MGAPRLMKPENVEKAAKLLADLATVDVHSFSELLAGAGNDRIVERVTQAANEAHVALRKKIVAELHALGVKVE